MFKKNMIDVIKKKFKRSQEELFCFNYLGLQISQTQNSIEVCLQNYTDPIKHINITKGRIKSDMLDEEEYHQLRGLPGQLNWVCNKTRPDISFHSSHANMSLKNATIDILPANKIVTKLKSPGPILEFK